MAKLKSIKNGIGAPELLNFIRSNASDEYRRLVPVANSDGSNIRQVGVPIIDFEGIRNEFVPALMNRIGIVEIKNRSYSNPLAIFKKGMMEYGQTIEEVFVDLVKEMDFVSLPVRNDLASQWEIFKPIVQSRFHTENRRKFYPITVHEQDLKKAFLSVDGFDRFVSALINSVYTTDAYHEFEVMKSMIAYGITANKFFNVKVDKVVDETTGKDLVKKIRAYSNYGTFLSRKYNPAGVATHSVLENQVLLIDPLVEANISVEVLAAAFNLPQADYLTRRVLIDEFGDSTTQAILVDREWFMIYDTLFELRTTDTNARHLYRNTFLHHHQVMSFSDFETQIRFSTEEAEPVVDEVMIMPNVAEVPRGTVQQFQSLVFVNGGASRDVVYTIESSEELADKTRITDGGRLEVDVDELNTTLSVVATSVFDDTKSATATVTLTAPIIGVRSNSEIDTESEED